MDISILDGASDGPGLGTLLEQARESVRGGRLTEARRTCETLVETHPEQPDVWYLLDMTASRILDIPNEALVADQEDWSRRMVAFCGLDWESRCLEIH